MDISHHFKFCQNRWNHLMLDLGLEEIMNYVDFLLTLSNSHLFVWAHLFFNTLGFVAVLQAYIWRENSNTNMFAQINYFWLVYGVLETVLLKIFHLYSSVLNRCACTFWGKVSPAWSYFVLHIYWFWGKIPPGTTIPSYTFIGISMKDRRIER